MADSGGTPRLWVRALASLSAQPLPGTENAVLPFGSPDSRFIAFFAEGNRLVAQRWDPLRMRPVGQVVLVDDAPPTSSYDGASLLSASANGVVVHPATTPPHTRLVWLDRSGRTLGSVPLPPASYGTTCLSPDDQWATVTKFNSPTRHDLWKVDLRRAVATRLTFDGNVAGGGGAAWRGSGRPTGAGSPTCTTGPASTTCTRCPPAGRVGRSR